MTRFHFRNNSTPKGIRPAGLIPFGVFLFLVFVSLPAASALLQGNQVRFIDGGGVKAPPREIVYDLDESSPDSYFWITLGKKDPLTKTIEGLDLNAMNYLSFWFKVDESSTGVPVQLFMELEEDTNQDKRFTLNPDVSSRVFVGKFSVSEGKTAWKKAVIPLSKFSGIRYRDRLLEMGFALEIKKGKAEGKLLVDRLLFGSNYPGGIQGQEIHMQNRVSSFKIGSRVAEPEMFLKKKAIRLALTLNFIDPYLEVIRLEASPDEGKSWQTLEIFYDHQMGGVYSMNWEPLAQRPSPSVLIRAVGMSVLGGEAELAGPYRIHFN